MSAAYRFSLGPWNIYPEAGPFGPPAAVVREAADLRKRLADHGLVAESVAPRLWEHAQDIDGGYTSNCSKARTWAIDIALAVDRPRVGARGEVDRLRGRVAAPRSCDWQADHADRHAVEDDLRTSAASVRCNI